MTSRPQTLTSVSNAVRVLKSFTTTQREWGVSDLARSLGLGKSTVHRLMATLCEEGMLEQDPMTGRYRLGLVAFDLAAAVPRRYDLHEAVLSPLTELRNRTGETVQVAVLDGREVVYIERLDSPHTLRMFLEVGRRNSAHSTATGKVLLAHLPQARLDHLLRGWRLTTVTEHSITDHEALRRALRDVRRQGYAENRNESEVGVISYAAPIRDATGSVVAAVSVAGPAERLGDLALPMVQAVMETGAQASRRMGHRAVA